jgi:hypothetical protein
MEQGVSLVKAQKASAGDGLATEMVFAVSSRSDELLSLIPNISLMKGLEKGMQALDNGARLIPSEGVLNPLLNESAVRRIPKRTSLEIGAAPIIFVILAFWSALVIFFRRKWGGR